MLDLRFPWLWRIPGWLLVTGVIVGSLMPPGAWVQVIAVQDKLVHAGAYFVLMLWFSGLYRRDRQIYVGLLLFVLGLVLDVAQAATTSRMFDLLDIAANGGGILLGLILSRLVFAGWCRRVERLFGAT